MSTNFEFTTTLPTNGFYYKDGPVEVTMKEMTTQQEKLLLGSTSQDILSSIVADCIVSPQIDINNLLASDLHYLIMQLRIHTYGSQYKVEFSCPHCGQHEVQAINLDDLIVYRLEEEFEEPIEFKLPKSGDSLACRLLLHKDSQFINNFAKKLAKTSAKANRQQIAYDLRMAKHIVKINGKDVDDTVTQGYVKKMHGQDSAYFWWNLNKVKIGYDTGLTHTCSNCTREFDVNMPMSGEFFRPTFD